MLKMIQHDDGALPLAVKLKQPAPWIMLFVVVIGAGAVWLSQELATIYRRTARDATLIDEIVLSVPATADTLDLLRSGVQALAKQRQSVAQAVFNQVLQEQPQSIAAMLGLAQLSYEEGKLGQAQAQVAEVLEINPQSPQAYFLQANILRKSGQQQDAYVAFTHCIEVDNTGQFKPVAQQILQSLR